LAAGLCLGGALLLVGCKQSENQRCEVDNDCSTGLKCVNFEKGDGTCKSTATDAAAPMVDATVVTTDAPVIDGVPFTTDLGGDQTPATPDAPVVPVTDGAVDGALDSSSN
jgi:hypothetical protein